MDEQFSTRVDAPQVDGTVMFYADGIGGDEFAYEYELLFRSYEELGSGEAHPLGKGTAALGSDGWDEGWFMDFAEANVPDVDRALAEECSDDWDLCEMSRGVGGNGRFVDIYKAYAEDCLGVEYDEAEMARLATYAKKAGWEFDYGDVG